MHTYWLGSLELCWSFFSACFVPNWSARVLPGWHRSASELPWHQHPGGRGTLNGIQGIFDCCVPTANQPGSTYHKLNIECSVSPYARLWRHALFVLCWFVQNFKQHGMFLSHRSCFYCKPIQFHRQMSVIKKSAFTQLTQSTAFNPCSRSLQTSKSPGRWSFWSNTFYTAWSFFHFCKGYGSDFIDSIGTV